jgi:hypothetical protein
MREYLEPKHIQWRVPAEPAPEAAGPAEGA